MMLRRDYRWSIIAGTAAFAAVFLFMALAVAALLSFDAGAPAAGIMDAYTLRILRFTLYQATLSTVLSILLGLRWRWRSPADKIFRGGYGSSG